MCASRCEWIVIVCVVYREIDEHMVSGGYLLQRFFGKMTAQQRVQKTSVLNGRCSRQSVKVKRLAEAEMNEEEETIVDEDEDKDEERKRGMGKGERELRQIMQYLKKINPTLA